MTMSSRPARIAGIAGVLAALLTASLIVGLASSNAGAASTCPTGTSVTPQNSPCVIHGYKDGPITLTASSSFQRIATLPLPAGKFALSGTLHVVLSGPPDFTPQNVDCRLVAGTDLDLATGSFNSGGSFAIYALSTAHVFTSGGQAFVACNTHGLNGFVAGYVRVTAVRAGTLHVVAMS